jgi:hypothetical protein
MHTNPPTSEPVSLPTTPAGRERWVSCSAGREFYAGLAVVTIVAGVLLVRGGPQHTLASAGLPAASPREVQRSRASAAAGDVNITSAATRPAPTPVGAPR